MPARGIARSATRSARTCCFADLVGDYTLEQAIRVGRDLERLEYEWFEEPFRDFELAKDQSLCATVAATETTRGAHWGVAQAITQRAADIVRADVSGRRGSPDAEDMANLHVSCAIRNCENFELFVPEEAFRFPMRGDLPVDRRGLVHVPQGPGLGVDLDWDAIDRLCISHKVTAL